MDQLWVNRAASAEAAVAGRHLKRLWALPGTQLGVVAWPPTRRDRWFGGWHYWWQAHLLDCLVDAEQRDPQPERRIKIERQIRAHRLRNNGSWVNSYYDDMAWLALALERASRIAGVDRERALRKLNDQLVNAWVPEDGGGIPWRKQDQFFNAPANGPAGIFLARYGDRLRRAQQMADWIDDTLIDPETHLVFDGIKAGSLVRAQYTYCQGVVLGLETELAARTPTTATRRGCIDWSRPSTSTWRRPGCCAVPAAATAACSPGSPRATWRWSPPRCQEIPPPTPRPARPPATSCCPLRRLRGTTARPWRGCRCSGRSGIKPPSCPRPTDSRPSSSGARSPVRR